MGAHAPYGSEQELWGEHVPMVGTRDLTSEQRACALRALIICDGHRLEEPDHALSDCLCRLQVLSEARGALHEAQRHAERRLELVTRLGQDPLF